MRLFSLQETQDIIGKLKAGASVDSIRNEKKCGVKVLKRIIKEHSIPYLSKQNHVNQVTSRFTKMFTENSSASNCYIVKSIKQHNLIPHTCCHSCGLTEWLNGKLGLELDHINGINTDNRLENLRFLCPNCHSQTSNYKGKNINNGKVKVRDQVLRKALKEENNIHKALIKVGLTPKGANYERAYKLSE